MYGFAKPADRRLRRGAVACLVALLAACAPQVARPPPSLGGEPPGFPGASYRQRAAQGEAVFKVDADRSQLIIEVRRGGSLARLGHDHVVASHDLAGYIAPDAGRADLFIKLDTLVVDEPALRAEAGMDPGPSAADIAATRSNMLERVLESSRHPYASIAVDDAMAAAQQTVPIAVTLHGATRVVDATTQSARTDEDYSVQGSFAIDQSAFGIEPFSILAGAIAVQDRVKITFRIRARRMR